MRPVLIPALVPALVAAMLSVSALAATTAQHEAIGTVKSWNSTARILTLDSGATYTLPATAGMAFHTGEKVKVLYQFRDGRNIAMSATAVR